MSFKSYILSRITWLFSLPKSPELPKCPFFSLMYFSQRISYGSTFLTAIWPATVNPFSSQPWVPADSPNFSFYNNFTISCHYEGGEVHVHDVKNVLRNTGFKLESRELKDLRAHLTVTGEQPWHLYPRDDVWSSLRAAREDRMWREMLGLRESKGFSYKTSLVTNMKDWPV